MTRAVRGLRREYAMTIAKFGLLVLVLDTVVEGVFQTAGDPKTAFLRVGLKDFGEYEDEYEYEYGDEYEGEDDGRHGATA